MNPTRSLNPTVTGYLIQTLVADAGTIRVSASIATTGTGARDIKAPNANLNAVNQFHQIE